MKKVLYLLLLPVSLLAQPVERLVKVVVAPDHTDWTYRPGEPVHFTITVQKHGNPIQEASVTYKIGPELLPATKTETVSVATGAVTVAGGTMNVPGFLRCIATVQVDGKEYRGLGTAGFSPAAIKPTVTTPTDFKQFWEAAKADLAKVPLDARLMLLPERCTEKVNVYHVNLRNWGLRTGRVPLHGYTGFCVCQKGRVSFPPCSRYPALVRDHIMAMWSMPRKA